MLWTGQHTHDSCTLIDESPQYMYDEKFTDTWSKGPCIHQLRYVEELRLLLVVETGASVIKIFDEHCNYKRTFNPPSSFIASLPDGQQQKGQRRAPVPCRADFASY